MSDVERKKLFCLLVMSSTKSKLDSPFFPQERNHHAKIDSGYLVYSRMKSLEMRAKTILQVKMNGLKLQLCISCVVYIQLHNTQNMGGGRLVAARKIQTTV